MNFCTIYGSARIDAAWHRFTPALPQSYPQQLGIRRAAAGKAWLCTDTSPIISVVRQGPCPGRGDALDYETLDTIAHGDGAWPGDAAGVTGAGAALGIPMAGLAGRLPSADALPLRYGDHCHGSGASTRRDACLALSARRGIGSGAEGGVTGGRNRKFGGAILIFRCSWASAYAQPIMDQ